MGNLLLTPEDESLVLVPPRFSVRGLTRAVETENPMSLYFGNLFRREVLQDLHSFKGDAGLDLLIAPDLPPAIATHVSLNGSVLTKTVSGGDLHLHLNQYFGQTWHALGRLSLGTDTGLTGIAILCKHLENSKISVTAALENSEPKSVGCRGESSHMLVGTELPVADPKLMTAWGVGRVSDNLWFGLSGQPLQEKPALEVSGSLEKKIPNTDSSYCVSSNYKVGSKQLTIGFSQHLVTHRKVYNVFEDKRVKFIANYVDVAVEATTVPKGPTNVLAGVSWQPNKNILVKLHASTEEGVVATGAVRNYWIPSVLLAVSAGIDTKGTPFVGGKLQVSNWLSSAEYHRGRPISTLPATRWLDVNEIDRVALQNRFETAT